MQFDGSRITCSQVLKKAQTLLLDQFELQGAAYDYAVLESAYEKVRGINVLLESSISNSDEPSNVETQAEFNKSIFEYCLREFVWGYRAKADTLSLKFTSIFLLFDFLFFVADKGECDTSFPLLMIEELSSTSALNDLRYIVTYLSDRILIITNQLVPAKGKGLAFLRLCNELQRRCSKLNDAHMIGELKILLTLAFPLNDRSGLNPRGDFDVSNPVKPEASCIKEYETEIQEVFLRFWKGQDYLASPFLLFEESAFEDFQKGVNWSLKVFETNIRDARLKVRAHKKSAAKSSDKVASSLKDSSSDAPRHLPEITLLPFQMCDPDFQKTIMVQYLIVFQYLLSLTPEDSTKFPAAAKPPTGFAWKDQQVQWMTERTRLINTLLRDIPFGSDKFPRLVRAILKVESVYAERKNVGAKPVDTKQEDKEAALLREKAKQIESSLKNPLKPLDSMGSAVKLAHLWKLGEHNKVFPKGASFRRDRPSLENFISRNAKRALDLDEDDPYRQALSWKALRLASKTHSRLIAETTSIDIMDLKAAMKTSKRPSPAPNS